MTTLHMYDRESAAAAQAEAVRIEEAAARDEAAAALVALGIKPSAARAMVNRHCGTAEQIVAEAIRHF